jgi:prophage maintenance system killer protein
MTDKALSELLIQLDFPRSAFWRIATDGCEHAKGPAAFRSSFHKDMQAGFELFAKYYLNNTPLSLDMIIKLHASSYQNELIYKSENQRDAIKDPKFAKSLLESYTPQHADFRASGCEYGLSMAPVLIAGMDANLVKEIDNTSAVSEKGLSELIENMLEKMQHKVINTYENENSEEHYAVGATISLGAVYFDELVEKELQINSTISPEFKTQLTNSMRKLLLAGGQFEYDLAQSKILNKPQPDFNSVPVRIVGAPVGRTSLHESANRLINTYLKNIENHGKDQEKILEEIIKLIRCLHQDHYFHDGNGRTFVFLLKNYLLLQNGFGLGLTSFPAHFTGYSIQELKTEIYADIKQFSIYKITAAKTYLQSLTLDDIENNLPRLAQTLSTQLAADNLIALDQLNELYLQVKDKQIPITGNYVLQGIYKFFTRKNNNEQEVLYMVQDLYLQKAVAHIHSLPQNLPAIELGSPLNRTDSTTNHKEIFKEILSRQVLYSNNLKSQIDEQLDLHFAAKPTLKP